MTPLQLKLVIGLLIILGSFLGGAFGAYTYEHNKLVALKADLKAQVDAQTAKVVALDAKVKENASAADTNLITSIDSIHAYYKSNPVTRVLHDGNCGPLPSTVGDPSHPYAPAASLYASPYSPEDTELVADQLRELQDLLTKDGVTVK